VSGGPVVLYTSENCGLCDHAKQALARIGVSHTEVLIADDHPYRLRTPVIEAAGEILAEGDIDEASLRRALERLR